MSTEPKFTTGPWRVTGISQETGNISVGQRDLRIVIADVTNAASFGDMVAGAMARGGGSFRQSDATTQFANAHLISAAPTLFHALNGLIGLVQLVRQRDDCPLEIKQALAGNYRLDDAFEAISKANPAVGHSNLQGEES